MAEMTVKLQLKIQDLDSFKRLVSALGGWAEEAQQRGSLTPAEAELFSAAVELEDTAKG
ncbi:hypothetical protein [Roseinatronobacter bogoriensis]|uniref:hypothetical protein n=1 Tax=Roseinatronobacter bogoriensis TaxID=119542 RepID=UPI0014562D37|nr:hypothetical protein [Rhodobaca bogoriensis]MBB4207281.1 hypothetical protein [Rhodobaca bogoriensis DSM 18756]